MTSSQFYTLLHALQALIAVGLAWLTPVDSIARALLYAVFAISALLAALNLVTVEREFAAQRSDFPEGYSDGE